MTQLTTSFVEWLCRPRSVVQRTMKTWYTCQVNELNKLAKSLSNSYPVEIGKTNHSKYTGYVSCNSWTRNMIPILCLSLLPPFNTIFEHSESLCLWLHESPRFTSLCILFCGMHCSRVGGTRLNLAQYMSLMYETYIMIIICMAMTVQSHNVYSRK